MTRRLPIADAHAELTFLGVLMRDPDRLDDRSLSPTLFAIPPHAATFQALRSAHHQGLLAGDLETAIAACAAQLSPAAVAEAFVRAEDVLPTPLKKHITLLAHRRYAHELAAALVRTADTPGDLAEDRDTFETLSGQIATLGVNGTPAFTSMGGIMVEHVDWLWHRRVPLGKLTLLDGDPGLGKTALALDLAARLSTGASLPDDPWPPGSPMGVVIVNAEDGIGDTLRPRLEAAGADLARIAAFPLDHIPVFPQGVSLLRDAIRAVDASLVIIDPLMAVLAASIDAYRDQDVRLVLNPLGALADQTHVAILCIRHLTKSPGPKALYRGSGSIAFSGVPRLHFTVGPDPDDPTLRTIAQGKNNLGPKAPALRFALDPVGPSVHVRWLGTTATTADELVEKPDDDPDAVQEAIAVLQSLLANGPIAADVANRERKRLGVSDYAWKRARSRLHVRTEKEGFSGGWRLQLPS
jgi:hypothetical protein